MGTPSVTELRALAELRHRDPSAVFETVSAALPDLPEQSLESAVAHWVVGLAHHEMGRPTEAVRSFRTALRKGARHGHGPRVEAARGSLAMSLLAIGDTAGARRELVAARAATTGRYAAEVEALWAVLLQRTGSLPEALEVFGQVLPRLRRAGNDSAAARLLLNRGTLFAYQGQFTRAAADLAESERLADERGLSLLSAMAAHNLGFLSGRSGDVPAALAGFDRARAAYRAVGDPPRQVAVLEADRSELLLQAGLAHDARRGAERVLALLEASDVVDRAHHAEVRLLMAQALLAEGRAADAGRHAQEVAAAFRKAGRRSWAAMADYVAAQAEVVAVEDDIEAPPVLLTRTRRIARTLERLGWTTEAEHVRTLLGRVALSLGQPELVLAELGRRSAVSRTATVDARTTSLYATALRLLAGGDRAGAKDALRRGLDLVDRYRAGMTATELRAGAGARATELARLGLRMALADGRPAEVMRWAERWRAGSLRLPPVRPHADEALAARMAELVEARAERRDAVLTGRAGPELTRRVVRLERAVRDRGLLVAGPGEQPQDRFDLLALRRHLGSAVLVEYVSVERRLWAVTVDAEGQRLHDLGPLQPILQELEFLLAALRRAASAVAAVRPAGADRLDRMLVGPLHLDPLAPLVVVPTGGLHGVPWSALASTHGRPLVVAPSADLWLRRHRPPVPPPSASVTLVAGPDLPGGLDEVHRLAEFYPGAQVLVGPAATVASTLDALARADLVHIAAHGQFRADSPLFSSLLLADGLLTVFDMEQLPSAAASTVVLPACDAARSDVRLGDEIIGTTTALLVRGVRTVVAPVVPVPDTATSEFMIAFHQRLLTGQSPSVALAGAALELSSSSSASTSFVCIGAAGS